MNFPSKVDTITGGLLTGADGNVRMRLDGVLDTCISTCRVCCSPISTMYLGFLTTAASMVLGALRHGISGA